MPENLKNGLTLIFGVSALGMGIGSVMLMQNMPVSYLWSMYILPLIH